MGEFSEDRDKSVLQIDTYDEFVRAASEVLHECARWCIIRLNDRDSRPVPQFLYEQFANCFVVGFIGLLE